MFDLLDVTSARKGNKEAFIRIIEASESTMYRIAKSIVKSDEDCADAIQETILKAYTSIESLKEPKFFKTWLIRILINVCNQILRSKQKVIPLEGWKEPVTQTGSYDEIEVNEVVNSLNEETRMLVILYYFEDLSVKQIAQTLEIPEGTVKSRLSRARNELSRLFQYEGKKLLP
ncbi:sigma-70 family RNA polymerase sigma factor [Bacillus sp. 31A1R]|uniref:Sigma-70 family RNA polymerase sigma factor n=1 Tax=Robertmurraya mangrovi TaxID=3098077 RepID=A0ABU5J5C2_9BACI|nr:sigma-70 family RNA polymerase sigma factor [Bacillus sp. 31A1R]MDZ5474603.1 sigma-70 family RNA polymerase sigma factor [Bacillus sp. 31A1R]